MHLQRNKKVYFSQSVKVAYFTLALLISLSIFVNAIKFFTPDFSSGFLSNKVDHFWWYAPPLYLHIFGASAVALLGLLAWVVPKTSRLHSWSGKIYFMLITFLAAPSGIIMASLAIGGWPSIVNFMLLGILWIWFTLKAYRYARRRDIAKHKTFAYRSLIVSNSAILMRLLFFFGTFSLEIERVFAYQIAVWFSWLPFLLLFELIHGGRIFEKGVLFLQVVRKNLNR